MTRENLLITTKTQTLWLFCNKQDGVGPLITDPPPTISTLLSKKLKLKVQVTGDMRHVTGGGGEQFIKISAF